MFPAVGKRGKRRSCQWKELTANEWNHSVGAPLIRRNNALRHLVVATPARICRLIYFYRLLDVGSVSGEKLFRWELPFAVLFAGTVRRFATQLVRAEAAVWRIAEQF